MRPEELRGGLETLHRSGFAWALTCCGWNRAEAEDVLQTSYLKILDGRARFDGGSSLKTWFFAVIRLTAAEARRSAGPSAARALVATKETPPVKADDPERRLAGAEERDAVRRSLAALPDRQRQVLDLVFYHDLSIAAAALVMGVSLGTARTHYERGKRAVLAALPKEVTA